MKTAHSFIIASLFGIFLCLSLLCCNKLFPDEKLTLPREDYLGNELRTDGYYYAFFSETNITAVMFLYRNGISISQGGYATRDLDEIEKRVIKDKFNSKVHWGVFVVNGNKIQHEKWVGSTGIGAVLNKGTGHIENDTTIHFTERYNSEYQKTHAVDEIWHFKQFNNKPDSTNNYIK